MRPMVTRQLSRMAISLLDGIFNTHITCPSSSTYFLVKMAEVPAAMATLAPWPEFFSMQLTTVPMGIEPTGCESPPLGLTECSMKSDE